MANRSREEILAKMLETCLFPVKRTTIIYGAALSFAQLKMYMQLLDRTQLIEQVEVEGVSHYVATTKGKEFLKAYQTVNQIIR